MPEKEKTFSIIIATYNAAESLQNTLDSIRAQICLDYELILIDGNSSDATVKIINENIDFVSFWISEPDKGLYDAWNKGIKASKGNWIAFLGAGDTLLPDALLSYKTYIDSLAGIPDYISAIIKRTNEKGDFISVLGEAWRWNGFRDSMTVAHVGSLHNKQLFEEIGFYNQAEYKICADYELLLRKKDKLKTGFLNQPIGEMPIGGLSFSVKALKESARAKYKTGRRNFISVFIYFLYFWLLLKTYRLRHSQA